MSNWLFDRVEVGIGLDIQGPNGACFYVPGPSGRAENVAFADNPKLDGHRVYLCGYPPMVNAAKKKAYLMGADLADIYIDPFELRDLRSTPRG